MRSNNKSSQVIVNANANLSDSQLGGATSANLQSSPINAGGHQTGGGSSFTSSSNTTLEHWLDSLDMKDEKWSEKLVQRIEREFSKRGKA